MKQPSLTTKEWSVLPMPEKIKYLSETDAIDNSLFVDEIAINKFRREVGKTTKAQRILVLVVCVLAITSPFWLDWIDKIWGINK